MILMEGTRNSTKLQIEKMKRINFMEDLGVDGRTILKKWMIKYIGFEYID
jgi:hypothetical protein